MDFEHISGCLGEEFANDVNLEITPFRMSFKKPFSLVLFAQALQTSSETSAREYTIAKFKTLATTVWK